MGPLFDLRRPQVLTLRGAVEAQRATLEEIQTCTCLYCTVSRSGRSRRIDAAVMLWTATHLDPGRPRKHRGRLLWSETAPATGDDQGLLASVVAAGHVPVPFTLAAPGVSREKPPTPSGCSGARVTSCPRLTYRTVQRWHEQLLIPHGSPNSYSS